MSFPPRKVQFVTHDPNRPGRRIRASERGRRKQPGVRAGEGRCADGVVQVGLSLPRSPRPLSRIFTRRDTATHAKSLSVVGTTSVDIGRNPSQANKSRDRIVVVGDLTVHITEKYRNMSDMAELKTSNKLLCFLFLLSALLFSVLTPHLACTTRIFRCTLAFQRTSATEKESFSGLSVCVVCPPWNRLGVWASSWQR